MEVKQMTGKGQVSLSETLNRTGARCVAFEGSEFLFLERSDDADVTLSRKTVSELTTLSAIVSQDSIVMLDESHRVEALVGLSQLDDMSINDFSKIRSIGLVPQLTRQLGTWKRQERIRGDLWSVAFQKEQAPDEAIRQTLESRVLRPWGARRKVHSCFVVASKAKTRTFFSTNYDLCLEDALKGAGHREAMWECKLVTADHTDTFGDVPLGFSSAADASRELFKRFNHVYILFHGAHDLVGKSQGSDQSPGAATEKSARVEPDDPAPESQVDSSAVEERIETAAEALDSVLLTLTGSPGTVVDRNEATDVNVLPPTPAYDPVRKALEIREKLQQSVSFVDSATWAKARGNRSNPSAALGKYKQKGRIFSVRSGRRDLYPAFQFAENTAEPLPVIEEILKTVPKEAQGWSLLSWFEAKNVLLNNRKPSEVLAREPDAALAAAVRFYSRDD